MLLSTERRLADELVDIVPVVVASTSCDIGIVLLWVIDVLRLYVLCAMLESRLGPSKNIDVVNAAFVLPAETGIVDIDISETVELSAEARALEPDSTAALIADGTKLVICHILEVLGIEMSSEVRALEFIAVVGEDICENELDNKVVVSLELDSGKTEVVPN